MGAEPRGVRVVETVSVGGARMTSVAVVLALSGALVPVIVNEKVAVVAVRGAVTVRAELVVAEAGLKLAVTPEGRPEVARATALEKPPFFPIVTV